MPKTDLINSAFHCRDALALALCGMPHNPEHGFKKWSLSSLLGIGKCDNRTHVLIRVRMLTSNRLRWAIGINSFLYKERLGTKALEFGFDEGSLVPM